MVVPVLVGQRFGPRERIFDAVIDKVEVKPLGDVSPREIQHENSELRHLDEFIDVPAPPLQPRDQRGRPRDRHPLLRDPRAAPLMRVGVVGLGTMGAPMARHLLERRHERDRAQPHPRAARSRSLALGATPPTRPARRPSGADAVLTCVSDAPDLEEVVLGGRHRRRPGARRGAGRLLDRLAQRRAQARRRARARGAPCVDAPVSGGSEGAERGTLTVFCGGSDEAVDPRPAGARGLQPLHHAPRARGLGAGGQGRQPDGHRGHLRGAGRGAGATPRSPACRWSRWSRPSPAAPPTPGCCATAPAT